ncbi:hypothetical protein ACIBP4_10990 [Micromonospora maritima]|uniref:Flagellar hook-length control protein FliK n=1 Tax=Micromonospora maritima TaxID=986711 RepID=A0ABW7ZKR6_9ACTN
MSARAARAAAVALVVAATVAGPATPATAGSAGYCPDASGVTVVVDFQELGGGTVVRCARGDQATGLAALKNAGFSVTGTLRWGEGFVCRLDGRPSAASEKCVDTPPASAYWSYWHASNGGGWTYSDKGVLNRRPPAGSFEGWAFSTGRGANDAPRPGVAPKRPAPPPPPPASSPRPPAGGGPVAPPPAGTAGPAAPPPVGKPGGPPVAATSPVTTAAPSGTPVASPSGLPTTASGAGTPPPGTPPPSTLEVGPAVTEVAARDDRDDGVPIGTLAGVLLLAALVAGGLVAARRRRAGDPDD